MSSWGNWYTVLLLLSRNNAKSSLFVSPPSDILHIGMANQLNLSNSVDISFGKSSASGFNCCLAPYCLKKLSRWTIASPSSNFQGSLGKVIAALYVITGNDQVSHFNGVGKKFSYEVFLTMLTLSPEYLWTLLAVRVCMMILFQIQRLKQALCSVIRLICCVYLNLRFHLKQLQRHYYHKLIPGIS